MRHKVASIQPPLSPLDQLLKKVAELEKRVAVLEAKPKEAEVKK